MSLTTYFYEPFHRPLFAISDFGRLFDAAWDARGLSSSRDLSRSEESPTATNPLRPRMDLHESKGTNEMTATFELPGIKKEDVSIDVHQNRLVISGQSTISKEVSEEGYTLRERKFGKFSRAIPLPTGIKPDDIKASMENGVLTVKFPKSYPDEESRNILIS